MKILVANLGSTSFKYRLFEISEKDGSETLLAQDGYERVEDYGRCIEDTLAKLKEGEHLKNDSDIDAVGFKTVLGRDLSGCVEADDTAIAALDGFKEVAPAHNPAYAEGIRKFREKLPSARRVALFETAFYQWIPDEGVRYAVPQAWHDAGIRRYGFHGASHKFIAERTAELLGRNDVANIVRTLYQRGPQVVDGDPVRVVSCHLGGSSSITGVKDGVAIGNSMGFSPQSGLPQNNRVGDLDSMAIPYAMKKLGLTIEEAERQLTNEGGLLGISGVSNDMRDVRDAAYEKGNSRAELAIDVLIHQIRHWMGSYFFAMGGADAIAFTGGIGEYGPVARKRVCAGLESLGIEIDDTRNDATMGIESEISTDPSSTKIFVIPANEELVIAREVYRFMQAA